MASPQTPKIGRRLTFQHDNAPGIEAKVKGKTSMEQDAVEYMLGNPHSLGMTETSIPAVRSNASDIETGTCKHLVAAVQAMYKRQWAELTRSLQAWERVVRASGNTGVWSDTLRYAVCEELLTLMHGVTERPNSVTVRTTAAGSPCTDASMSTCRVGLETPVVKQACTYIDRQGLPKVRACVHGPCQLLC